jgi:hypothetical protein
LAGVWACPDDWTNPCIISSTSTTEPLRPRENAGCYRNGADYLGTARQPENAKYVNTGGRYIPGFSWSGIYGSANYLNLPSYNANDYGTRDAAGSHGSDSEYYGLKYMGGSGGDADWGQLYTSETYLQECSNICTNHPECTSFSFDSMQCASSDMDNDADGDCGDTNQITTGTCHLFSECLPQGAHWDADGFGSTNTKSYWLGIESKDSGVSLSSPTAAERYAAGVCVYKATNPNPFCQAGHESRGLPETCQPCVPGFFKPGPASRASCTACPPGTFASGHGSAACTPCRTCPAGEHAAGTFAVCSTTTDTTCSAHGVCSSGTLDGVNGPFTDAEFQTAAPSATADRECTECEACSPGSMVAQGCNKADPWAGQSWHSDAAGGAANAVSVSQDSPVDGKVVIVHHGDFKIACGKLRPAFGACPAADPFAASAWASDAEGAAAAAVAGLCVVPPIRNKVVVVHDSATGQLACGKLRANADGSLTAAITKLASSAHPRAVQGSFTLTQTGTAVAGTLALQGLESGAAGSWHIHEGESCESPGGHLLNPSFGLEAAIAPMPGFTALSVTGAFLFTQSGPILTGLYSLAGLPASGTGAFHVHEGTDCSSPGAHLANTATAAHGAHATGRRLLPANHDEFNAGAPVAGNAVCTPCVPGISFSTGINSPACYPVTPCATGWYETVAGTTTTDRQCSACTNGPPHSVFTTSGGTASDCKFDCTAGYTLTNAGAECSADELRATLEFSQHDSEVTRAMMHVYDNNAMQFQFAQGGCLDAPEFCGGSFAAMEEDVRVLRADIEDMKAFLVANKGF